MRTLAGSSQGWPTAGALLVGGNFDGVPDIEFPTWLPPDEGGPPRGLDSCPAYRPVGNVLVGESQGWSFSLNDHPDGAIEGSGGLPRTGSRARRAESEGYRPGQTSAR